MDKELKRNKQIIRRFLRAAYTDANLIEALEHARGGQMSWHSCCCLVGIPTADHALQPATVGGNTAPHYLEARISLPHAAVADAAYMSLCGDDWGYDTTEEADARRRRRLIPIILAEVRRRERERQTADETVCVATA